MEQSVNDHFYATIERARIFDEAVPHLYTSNVFPASFYTTLLEGFPAQENYSHFPSPYEERFGIELQPSIARTINQFWIDFEDWHSAELLNFLSHKFEPTLQECYEVRRVFVEHSSKGGNVETLPINTFRLATA